MRVANVKENTQLSFSPNLSTTTKDENAIAVNPFNMPSCIIFLSNKTLDQGTHFLRFGSYLFLLNLDYARHVFQSVFY